jgi:hypothetical protein
MLGDDNLLSNIDDKFLAYRGKNGFSEFIRGIGNGFAYPPPVDFLTKIPVLTPVRELVKGICSRIHDIFFEHMRLLTLSFMN